LAAAWSIAQTFVSNAPALLILLRHTTPTVAHLLHKILISLGIFALAAPASAAVDDSVADQMAACFGREDPVCAAPLLLQLQATLPNSTTYEYCKGVTEFLLGHLADAKTALKRVAASPLAPATVRERAQTYLDLAQSTAEVHAGATAHPMADGRAIVWLRPGPDEVLLPYMQRVLLKALPALDRDFGPLSAAPIQIYVYPRAEDLGKVSGLTAQQIHTSGTIALCKHNRVMLTSPANLLFGYAWADTVVHELVHYYIIKLGGPKVPIWLHEGMARSFEGAWRAHPVVELDRDEKQALLAARKKNKFITLARMSPSMALLPSQEDTQLAFAEVHHAVIWLLQRAAQAETDQAIAAQARQLVALFGKGDEEAQALSHFSQLSPNAFAVQWKRDLLKLDLHTAQASDATLQAQQPLVFRGGSGGGLDALSSQAKKFAELGDRLAVQKRPQAAAIEYRKAIASGQTEGPLLVSRLIRVLLDTGQTKEAQERLQLALNDWPEHAPLHVLQGYADVSSGHYREALEALDRATWLNPFDPQVHVLAAQAHAALGQDGDAAAAQARAELVACVTGCLQPTARHDNH